MNSKDILLVSISLVCVFMIASCSDQTDSTRSEKAQQSHELTINANMHSRPAPKETFVSASYESRETTQKMQPEQVLVVIRNADVDEKTHDLTQTMGDLTKICLAAMKTSEELLQVNLITDPTQRRRLIEKKEALNDYH